LGLKRKIDVSVIGQFSKVKSQKEKWVSKEEFQKRKKGKDKEGGGDGTTSHAEEQEQDKDDETGQIVAIRKIALAGAPGGDRLLVFASSG
jgi:hypothetical protein